MKSAEHLVRFLVMEELLLFVLGYLLAVLGYLLVVLGYILVVSG